MKKKPATTDLSCQGNYMDQEDNHAEYDNIFYEDGNMNMLEGKNADADYVEAPEDEQFSYNPFAQLKTGCVKRPQVSFRSC